MKPRNFAVEALFDAVTDEKLTQAERFRRVETAIDAIVSMQPIYEKFKQKSPERKFDPSDELINVTDERGKTPLIYTAARGYTDIVRVLLAVKATLDMPDSSCDVTPLMCAAQAGHTDIVLVLLEAKSMPDTRSSETGATSLTYAAEFGHTDVVRVLLAANATPGMPNPKHRKTPLTFAGQRGHTDVVRALLEANATVDMPDLKGDTVLMWAAYSGHRVLTDLLIVNYKAKLELQNLKGNTALDEAVKGKQLATTSLLLSHGAHIRHPQKLFDFLEVCDQRDPDVLVSLDYLSEQLSARLATKGAEEKQLIDDAELHTNVKTYLAKLKKLTEIYREKLIAAIDQATEQAITPVLLSIIAQFDAPLQGQPEPEHKDSRIKFFKPAEIDALLPKTEAKCIVM